jgi:2-hydroxychromene-2-carboxylate isomerase
MQCSFNLFWNELFKKMRALLMFFIIFLAIGCSKRESSEKGVYSIHGEFQVVSNLQKHTKKTVELEHIISFTCPHCFQSWLAMAALQNEYGEKLRVKTLPILPKNSDDSHLRLFYIAKKVGKSQAVIDKLFTAKFVEKRDISTNSTVRALANELGLSQEYSQERDAAWVKEAISTGNVKVKIYHVTNTPSWIIENQLNVNTNVLNLRIVMNDLLLESNQHDVSAYAASVKKQ